MYICNQWASNTEDAQPGIPQISTVWITAVPHDW